LLVPNARAEVSDFKNRFAHVFKLNLVQGKTGVIFDTNA